jgi:hypothetical protein
VTSIPLEPGAPSVQRVEAKLRERLRAPSLSAELDGIDAADLEAARLFWSQRAWSEYAAVPALAQVLLKSVAERAPADEVSALSGIVHDEALHTRLSQEAAEVLGGYLSEVPEGLDFDPYRFVSPTSLPRLFDLVLAGCLGETLSCALIRARLPYARLGGLRAVTERTLEDERVHVAFAWAVASEEIPRLDDAGRAELARLLEPHARAARQGTLVRANERAAARDAATKDRVAAAGLGSCPADEEVRVTAETFREIIVPRFRKLGVPIEEG